MMPLFSISGTVIKGSQLGRKLGYPTANLDLPDAYTYYSLTGVYAANVEMEEVIYPGMANIGFRPTLSQPSFTVEVNIFDFNRDLYGKTITIHFLDRIRDELRFNSLDELVTQMEKDETEIRKILSVTFNPNADSQ
ncbi:MAG: riboflavin kinase [Bacteroidota bacterium]